MKYQLKSGALSEKDSGEILAQIKSSFARPKKRISGADGTLMLCTDIKNLSSPDGQTGDIRFRKYTMTRPDGKIRAWAIPGYMDGEDPAVAGWPICRLPRVDHAQLHLAGEVYRLVMQDSQNYTLYDTDGHTAMQVFHKGIAGGWIIDAPDCFAPEVLCGIFVFCRYIEQENEFLLV